MIARSRVRNDCVDSYMNTGGSGLLAGVHGRPAAGWWPEIRCCSFELGDEARRHSLPYLRWQETAEETGVEHALTSSNSFPLERVVRPFEHELANLNARQRLGRVAP